MDRNTDNHLSPKLGQTGPAPDWREHKPEVKIAQAPEQHSYTDKNSAEIGQKAEATEGTARRIAEAAEQTSASREYPGMSWKANRTALKLAGIDAQRSDAKDVESIPKMTRMPSDTKLQPGDVVVVGAKPGHEHGSSFIVTEEMKAAGNGVFKIPDLSKEKDVRIFRS